MGDLTSLEDRVKEEVSSMPVMLHLISKATNLVKVMEFLNPKT